MILEKRLPLNYLFKTIIWDILLIFIFSFITHLISIYFMTVHLPIGISGFLGTAISLVLSFKISQSYERWWEARKIWGAIVNDSRSFVVQAIHFSPYRTEVEVYDIVHRMAYRQIAWCYTLSQTLRKLPPFQWVGDLISEEEKHKLKDSKNVPLSLINLHADDLRGLHQGGHVNDYQQVQMDGTLVRLCESMGKSERIKNTIFPKTYRITLHFFIYLFLVVLSLSLPELHGTFKIILLVAIAIPFFLLEKIAYHMQDPFENRPTDISMTSISRTIEINVKQLLEEKTIPEVLETDKFFVL